MVTWPVERSGDGAGGASANSCGAGHGTVHHHRGEFKLTVVHDEIGFEREIARLQAPAYFGESAILSGAASAASVVAVTPASVLVIGSTVLRELLKSDPRIALDLCAGDGGARGGFEAARGRRAVRQAGGPSGEQSAPVAAAGDFEVGARAGAQPDEDT